MELYAKTQYEAQLKAAKAFGAKKSWDVNVVLAEVGGKQVVHNASFAKGGKLSKKDFFKKYEENEDENMHTENVVLLAENYGTESDISDAKTILAKHESIGHLPTSLRQERDALHDKLWSKYIQSREDGGMMAHGGSVGKIYYHILEYGDYGNIGYQGYYETEEEAKKEINRLSGYFPDMYYEIFTSDSTQEPPVTTMAKGGEINYLKKWRVKGINMQGKMFQKEITLGRMSDKNDVINALKRMPDTNIREVTLIEEIKEDGGMMAKGGELTTYKILAKHKYDLQPKWKDEKLETGGREFLTFKQAQDFKKKLQGMTSSVEYKVVKVEYADGGMMAKGGRLSRKQKQLDLNKNGKLDSQDFKMLRAGRKNARKK
jgi:hypothetical protein